MTKKRMQRLYTANYIEQLQLMQNIKNWRYKQVCTDRELRIKIQMYNELQNELKKLVSQKDELAKFIINEMDNRKTVSFDGYKLITERLVENATKAGKQTLKDLFPDRVDEYINISLSRFINSANAKKINM